MELLCLALVVIVWLLIAGIILMQNIVLDPDDEVLIMRGHSTLRQKVDALIQGQQQVIALLSTLSKQETDMVVNVDALTAGVARLTDVSASVKQVVENLVAAIAAIPPSTDPATQAALDDLTAKLTAGVDTVAAAVVEGTPAAPPPAPPAA